MWSVSEGGHVDLKGLADGEDRVAAERLVDEHAGDAHHGGAAVVALSVELPCLAKDQLLLSNLLGRAIAQPDVVAVRIPGPRDALRDDVAGGLVRELLERIHLAKRDEEHYLEPRGGRQSRP